MVCHLLFLNMSGKQSVNLYACLGSVPRCCSLFVHSNAPSKSCVQERQLVFAHTNIHIRVPLVSHSAAESSPLNPNTLAVAVLLQGFHKILKKHDKCMPHAPCRQFYVAHLHQQPWVQVNTLVHTSKTVVASLFKSCEYLGKKD